jgi:hypothetical protein
LGKSGAAPQENRRSWISRAFQGGSGARHICAGRDCGLRRRPRTRLWDPLFRRFEASEGIRRVAAAAQNFNPVGQRVSALQRAHPAVHALKEIRYRFRRPCWRT